jgi:hypothetical protein
MLATVTNINHMRETYGMIVYQPTTQLWKLWKGGVVKAESTQLATLTLAFPRAVVSKRAA